MLAAAGAGESVAISGLNFAFTGSSIVYKILRAIYTNAHRDILDKNAFPVNETGARLWTIVIFACLTENALIRSDSHMHSDGLSGSDFAQATVFLGIVLHCTWQTLSHWSGAKWNWGHIWAYVVLLITLCVFTYVENDSELGRFSIKSRANDLTSNQQMRVSVVFSFVGVWVIVNLIFWFVKRPWRNMRNIVLSIKRIAWMALLVLVLLIQTTKEVNGEGQILHYHHALVAWAMFSCATIFGSPNAILSALNHFVGVLALGVMAHGTVTWGIEDFELITNSTGTGQTKSDRNILVSSFVGILLLLSIPVPGTRPNKKKIEIVPRQGTEQSTLLSGDLQL